jgi:hypothetical protein
MKIVSVKYQQQGLFGGKDYYYKSFDDSVGIGDMVVICNNYGNGESNYNVAKVCDVLDSSEKAKYWIVCKVDIETRKHFVETQNKIEELKEQILHRIQDLQTCDLCNKFSEKDDALAIMLNEITQIEGMENIQNSQMHIDSIIAGLKSIRALLPDER